MVNPWLSIPAVHHATFTNAANELPGTDIGGDADYQRAERYASFRGRLYRGQTGIGDAGGELAQDLRRG